jgi:hypothetical protein
MFGKATGETFIAPPYTCSLSLEFGNGALRNAQSKNDCFLGGGNKPYRS